MMASENAPSSFTVHAEDEDHSIPTRTLHHGSAPFSVPPTTTTTSSSSSSSHCDMECMICAEKATAIFCFSCGHYTCYSCGLRIRQMEQSCPVCRKSSANGVLTTRVSTLEDQYCEEELQQMRANASYDIKLSCFVDSPALAAEMAKLYLPLCPLPSCWDHGQQVPFTALKWLKAHLQQDHQLFYCSVCLQRRPLFLAEQTLYTAEALQLHRQGLWKDDPAAFAGHPYCVFCGTHTLYLDGEDLMKHMLQHHFYCDFCNRDQFLFTFFCTREEMYAHFRSAHKICEHPKCAGLDTMLRVYRDEFDLDVHRQREHHARPTSFKPADFTRATHPSSSTPAAMTSGNSSSSGSHGAPGGDTRYPSLTPSSHPLLGAASPFRSHSPASASAAAVGVSNAADITVARITFDFMTHQQVLDLTPKNRAAVTEGNLKGGKGRGWRKKNDKETSSTTFPASFSPFKVEESLSTSPDGIPAVKAGDRALFPSHTAGLPTHFVHPAHTMLRTALQRRLTPEEAAAAAAAIASSSSSPSSCTEDTTMVHGHWGTQPTASHPMISYVDGASDRRGGGEEKNGTTAPGWGAPKGNATRTGEGSGAGWRSPLSIPANRTGEDAAPYEGKDQQEHQGNASTTRHQKEKGKKKGLPTTPQAEGDGATSSGGSISGTMEARSAHDRLNALLHQHLPDTHAYHRFTLASRDFMDSTIKTSEYYDILNSFFPFEVLEQVIPLFIASCPMEDKRVALRELWKMKTSPEMVRREKVRREEEEEKREKEEEKKQAAAAAAMSNRKITIWGSSKSGVNGNRKDAWKTFADEIRQGDGGKVSHPHPTAATPSIPLASSGGRNNTTTTTTRSGSRGGGRGGDGPGTAMRIEKEGSPSFSHNGMTYAAVAGKKTKNGTPPHVVGQNRTSPEPSLAAYRTPLVREAPLAGMGGVASPVEGKKEEEVEEVEEEWMVEEEEKESWNNSYRNGNAGDGGPSTRRDADEIQRRNEKNWREVENEPLSTVFTSTAASFKKPSYKGGRGGGGGGSSWATMATAPLPHGQAALAPAAFPVDPPRPLPKPSKHVDGNAKDQFPSLFSAEAQREHERRAAAATAAAAKRAGKKPQLNAWFPQNKKN